MLVIAHVAIKVSKEYLLVYHNPLLRITRGVIADTLLHLFLFVLKNRVGLTFAGLHVFTRDEVVRFLFSSCSGIIKHDLTISRCFV